MAERGSTMKSLKRAGVLALALAGVTIAALIGGPAKATPPIRAMDFSAFGSADTTLSVTSSTDTTIFFGFPASYVCVTSQTAGMNIACQPVGSGATIRQSNNSSLAANRQNQRAGLAIVDHDLTIFTATSASDFVSKAYDVMCNAVYYGVRIDGQSTGTVYIEWSRCAQ